MWWTVLGRLQDVVFQLNRNQNRRRQQNYDPPPSTRTDVSMSREEATTREARRLSFDAIAEEANTTKADTTNLLGPPSQTNQRIEHAKKIDFTLDPRPCLNNDDGNAGFIQLKTQLLIPFLLIK